MDCHVTLVVAMSKNVVGGLAIEVEMLALLRSKAGKCWGSIRLHYRGGFHSGPILGKWKRREAHEGALIFNIALELVAMSKMLLEV